MNNPVLFALESGLPLRESLQTAIGADAGEIDQRRFPDGESYLRILSPVRGRYCVVLANLCRPDEKILPLLFLARSLRMQGATGVGLVAPYLCYMRQDKVFMPGEAVTSRIFAQMLSTCVDWLVTVDPHLHRYRSLDEIYTIPSRAISGMPAMQAWLASQPAPLLLVGPDRESQQWVAALAGATGLPFIVGKKQRHGDREVSIDLPADNRIANATSVIVDDVISSGHTVLQTLAALRAVGAPRTICAAVHGIFAEGADEKIRLAGADLLATSNSIPGDYCAFDLAPLLAPAVQDLLARADGSPHVTRDHQT
ncbi:ribose-phosphate diphosphokinase [Microbulbifer pacificus]|uniref:Ribose-phosphate diphosphokinase n=1 Tax=Microbulbifer pacificus TaxID=407164 RepID=A0AAU0MX43_9GAMM|nr:ribose-phosphate diphosphokinase [Microbulbifer pacificus]WOX05079.1 ribose-phosphate diphosphokinase [Microbulbifer pacificus]